MQGLPDYGNNSYPSGNGDGSKPWLEYQFRVPAGGDDTFKAYVRGYGATGTSDSAWVIITDQSGNYLTSTTGSAAAGVGFSSSWTWQPSLSYVLNAGTYVVHVMIREDGVAVDKIILQSVSIAAPSNASTGPAETPDGFTAWSAAPGFVPPTIWLQYNPPPLDGTGALWCGTTSGACLTGAIRDLPHSSTNPGELLRDAIAYLDDGIQLMAGQCGQRSIQTAAPLMNRCANQLGVENATTTDLESATGIVLTTYAGAPVDVQNDPAVIAALNPSNTSGSGNIESYYIRSEPTRLLVVANQIEGLITAIPDVLESVGYTTLGIGPNWTYVPDEHGGLVFNVTKSGAPGFLNRALPMEGIGEGVISEVQHPNLVTLASPDEYSDDSVHRWEIGTRTATATEVVTAGNNKYTSDMLPQVVGHIRYFHTIPGPELADGFLARTTVGSASARAAAVEAGAPQEGDVWIDSDFNPTDTSHGIWEFENGAWTAGLPNVDIDVSIGWVRCGWDYDGADSTCGVVTHDYGLPAGQALGGLWGVYKKRWDDKLAAAPDRLAPVGTESEDGLGLDRLSLAKDPDWYPKEIAALGGATWQTDGSTYTTNQPYLLAQCADACFNENPSNLLATNESWDPNSGSDTEFALAEWLLKKYDAYANGQQTSAGILKSSLIRVDLLSYATHDVPPDFNPDQRIRVQINDEFSQNRRKGKWLSLRTDFQIAKAYQALLPSSTMGDYLIESTPNVGDYTIQASAIGAYDASPLGRAGLLERLYGAGIRFFTSQTDTDFGKVGPINYLMARTMWNPNMSAQDLQTALSDYLEKAYGSAALSTMLEYSQCAWSGTNPIVGLNLLGECTHLIDQADQIIPDGTPEQARLDDLKQYWYHYLFVDLGLLHNQDLRGCYQDRGCPATPLTGDQVNALTEFVWKGQMGYQITEKYDLMFSGLSFSAPEAASLGYSPYTVQPYYSAPSVHYPTSTIYRQGPAHYCHTETQGWWSGTSLTALGEPGGVVGHWQFTPEIPYGAAGVDLNDLVSVQELGSDPSEMPYSSNWEAAGSDQDFPTNTPHPFTVIAHEGQRLGFKLFWSDAVQSPVRDVFWGLYRYAGGGEWAQVLTWDGSDDGVNSSSAAQSPVQPTVPGQSIPTSLALRDLVTVDASELYEQQVGSPLPTGTYRFVTWGSGVGATFTNLDWDTDVLGQNVSGGLQLLGRGAPGETIEQRFTYDYTAENEPDDYFVYIPRGTTELDFEVPIPNGQNNTRSVTLYQGLSPTAAKRTVCGNAASNCDVQNGDIGAPGVHRIQLQAGEAGPAGGSGGGIAEFKKGPVVQLYSVPMLWATSRANLLVPRQIVINDGLTIDGPSQ